MYCELCLVYHIFCAILYSVNVVQNYLSPALRVIYYVAILCVSRIMHFLVLYCMSLYTANIVGCVNKLCNMVVTPVLYLNYCSTVCYVCKSCVVFALLPAYTTASAVCCVCKSCVVFAQCTASAVCRAGTTTSPLIIILFAIFLHYCHRSVLCV